MTADPNALEAERRRIPLQLQDSEVVAIDVAQAKVQAERGNTNLAAAAFAELLGRARDRASKTKIIAEAAPLAGMLEQLADRAESDGQIQAELARQFAAKGDTASAEAARVKALAWFEEMRAQEPENSATAGELAQLLFDKLEPKEADWVVLKPSQTKTASGSKLTVQDDGSILVETAPKQTPEAVRWQRGPRPFQAVRIETSTRALGATNGAPSSTSTRSCRRIWRLPRPCGASSYGSICQGRTVSFHGTRAMATTK